MKEIRLREGPNGTVLVLDGKDQVAATLAPGERVSLPPLDWVRVGLTSAGVLSLSASVAPSHRPTLGPLLVDKVMPERRDNLDRLFGLPAGYRLLGHVDIAQALACPEHRFEKSTPQLAPDFDGFFAAHEAMAAAVDSPVRAAGHRLVAKTLLEVASSRATHTASRCAACGLTYGRSVP